MSVRLFCLFILASLGSATQGATLADAYSYWEFDGGTVNTGAAYTQVTDSSGNGHHAINGNFANLSWTTVPANGPYGGTAQSVSGHGIQFNPRVTNQVTGTANLDTVAAAHFQVNNATVSGSSTIVTRMRWDGAIPTLDDNTNQWLVNNGLGGWNETNKESYGYLFGLTTGGNLYYYSAGAGSGQTPSGVTHTYAPTTIALTQGEWYDVAMVLDDLNDGVKTTGRITFYVVGADGVFRTMTTPTTSYWISPGAAANVLIGSESPGTGTGNNRKAFNGALDYLAMFDTALTESEVRAIFAVPEPSRALLLAAGIAGMLLARRRRS